MPSNEDVENPSSKEEGPNTESNIEKGEKVEWKKVGIVFVIFIIIVVITGILNAKGTKNLETEAETLAPTDDGSSATNTASYFNRIATVPICLQLDETCNVDNQTVSEIVYANADGDLIAYTDSAMGNVGFIDITDPANPKVDGTIDVGGEPTSLVIKGNEYAIVCVNTSPDFVDTSGQVRVIDIESRTIIATMELGGQPDSVALSPDGNFVAIAIENERDEDLNEGAIPQLPAGFLVVMDVSSSDPESWTMSTVELLDLDGVAFPSDPEPEYVSINADNIVVVTLQENNGIVLVNLETLEVISSFTAGTVDLEGVDILENQIIEPIGSLTAVPREPDGVAWMGTTYFATADEGDMDGGSRGFTIFDSTDGSVVYSSGSEMDDVTIRYGHYQEGRSENKGNEPENVFYAQFGDQELLFVNSERTGLVFVYDVADVTAPVLRQVLPCGGVAPEGVFAIPARNLLIIGAEEDARDAGMRSAISIYQLFEDVEGPPAYPTLIAEDREDGSPIPFSALSGLSYKDGMLYSVEDSAFQKSRLFGIDVSKGMKPYPIVSEMMLMDTDSILADAVTVNASAIILNDDKSVNLDFEGIEAIEDGYWVVSEGSGTIDDPENPFETPNLLCRLDSNGVIQEVVTLPDDVANKQSRFGFEGVAVEGDYAVVVFQREWVGEESPRVGIYNTASTSWSFVFYTLDAPESQYGGWVGLSDIASIGDGRFLVLERDNLAGPDAAIKKIYEIDLGDLSSITDGSTIEKTFVYDLMPDLQSTGGVVMEKIEGLAIDEDGNVWIVNDNDGVEDHNGEQNLMNVGSVV